MKNILFAATVFSTIFTSCNCCDTEKKNKPTTENREQTHTGLAVKEQNQQEKTEAVASWSTSWNDALSPE